MTTIMKRHPSGIDLGDWMSRLFDDRLFAMPSFTDKGALRVEEFIDDSALVVRAEIPGIDPEKDVEISIHDGLLYLKAERRDSSEHKDKDGFRSEFHYGLLERVLALPTGVTADAVTATYKDGVLEVRMPKAKEVVAATVPVTRLP